MPHTLAPRTDFEALPTAEYVLTLKAWREIVEQADTQYSKKGDIRIEWNWIVAVPNAETVERRDWTNIPVTFAEKSTYVHIVVALGIVDSVAAIENGATIDEDQGIGKSCLGTIVKSLKKDGKTWGDKITQYAPLPANAAPKASMIDKLRERYSTLTAFSGEPVEPPSHFTQKDFSDALKVIGSKPITEKAAEHIRDQINVAAIMGINQFADTKLDGLTLKDALLLHEKITALVEGF